MSDPSSTPGSGDLVSDPVEVEEAIALTNSCPLCGHAVPAHAGGRCMIMLGAYGTEGPCPCPDMPAPAVVDVPADAAAPAPDPAESVAAPAPVGQDGAAPPSG